MTTPLCSHSCLWGTTPRIIARFMCLGRVAMLSWPLPYTRFPATLHLGPKYVLNKHVK